MTTETPTYLPYNVVDPSIQVIGICGKARAGKDTAAMAIADHIVAHAESVDFDESYVVGIEAFAGPIKSMVAMLLDFFGKGSVMEPGELYPYIQGDLKEEVIPEIGASPRTLMQTIGTEWGRGLINDNIWINSMRARYEKYKMMADHGYKGIYILMTDVRFENEAKAIKDLGGIILRIDRDPIDGLDAESDAHASELGVPNDLVDYVVNNNEDIDKLKASVLYELALRLPVIEEGITWAEEPEPADNESYEAQVDAMTTEEHQEHVHGQAEADALEVHIDEEDLSIRINAEKADDEPNEEEPSGVDKE